MDIRSSIRRNKTSLIPVVEEIKTENDDDDDKHILDPNIRETVVDIYRELHLPIGIKDEQRFKKSLNHKDTILLTLRVKDDNTSIQIVGYVKGGPLENYQLRRGTHD